SVLRVPLDCLLARAGLRRDPERLSVRGTRRGGAPSSRVGRVVGPEAAVEAGHDVPLRPRQVPVDRGGWADAEEDGAVTLAAEANRPQERVQRPLGAAGVDVGALGD